jgi:hypothetical protein
MKLSDFKKDLSIISELNFVLPNGTIVPQHFHVTEVGQITKHFIDCGGTVRKEKVVNFQLWEANDFDHRLATQKLLNIIELSEKKLGIEDLEIEVEYQNETINKYGLEFNGKDFVFVAKLTNCLAPDKCGIPSSKLKVNLSDIKNQTNCSPGGKCC